jgi:anti-sigma B factor antagonist
MSLLFETARIEPGITVVGLFGRLVAGPEGRALEVLVHDLVDAGERKVILDLSGIVKIDSAGVQFLIQCFFTMRQAQGDLRLADPAPKVARLFSYTRLDAVVPIYDSVASASAEFDVKKRV